MHTPAVTHGGGRTGDRRGSRSCGTGRPMPRPPAAWTGYRNGPAFLRHLRDRRVPRAVFNPLQGYGPGGWPH